MQSLVGQHMNTFLQKYSDILLAALVIGIVGMMIIPLPTFLLDMLLTLNFTIAVTLLMVSLYIPNALKISAFPSILLISTLFRLALNVSSTRLILLNADAGEVIAAFGNFVVQGNFVVGGVIFLILTLIQFLVIAKGAERVSEVGARFTLDAMPGKQMSIDADLRAGAFDLDEARRRRAQLQTESKLYGAMDGAMKFVKGDAIAGLIITAINIIAGIIIGVLQKNMPAGDAAQTYTLLTIGDGLVSQIPALLIATTAGIVVTRVSSEDNADHLGSDIFGQILAQPKALAITSALLAIFGIIPGLPTVPFLVLSAIVGTVAYGLFKSQGAPSGDLTEDEEAALDQVETQAREGARQARALIPAVTPLTIELGVGLSESLDDDRKTWLQEMIPTMREGIFHELGVKVPGVSIRTRSMTCQDFEVCVSIEEVPVLTSVVPAGCVLVNEGPEQLEVFKVDAQATRHPATRQLASWIALEDQALVEQAGYTTWDAAGYVLLCLTATLRDKAVDFVDIQAVQVMLDQLEGPYPAIVQEVVPKQLGVQDLTEVLKRLVDEGISLRNLPKILQILGQHAKATKDHLKLAEEVRAGLSRYITHKYAGKQGDLVVYLVDREIEEMIATSIKPAPVGSYLALPPDIIGEILEAVEREISCEVASGRIPILLTDQRVRRYMKKLISLDYPDAVVLAFQEVDPALRVQPLGRIAVGNVY